MYLVDSALLHTIFTAPLDWRVLSIDEQMVFVSLIDDDYALVNNWNKLHLTYGKDDEVVWTAEGEPIERFYRTLAQEYTGLPVVDLEDTTGHAFAALRALSCAPPPVPEGWAPPKWGWLKRLLNLFSRKSVHVEYSTNGSPTVDQEA